MRNWTSTGWTAANIARSVGCVFGSLMLPNFADAEEPHDPASPEPGVDVLAPPERGSSELPAYEPVRRLDERTAYMVGARRLKIGFLAIEYGIIDALSVGTDPPAWAAPAVLPLLIPNLHAKLQLYEHGPLAVSVRAAGYYATLSSDDTSGRLISVPLTLFASIPIAPRLFVHPEATYLIVQAFGSGDLDDADANGAVAARAAITGALLQYQLTEVVSLTALGRYQVYTGPLVFEADDRLDRYTTAAIDATLTTRTEHPWQAVAGVAMVWEHVQLTAGVGYGNYFVPGLEIALPEEGLVPDFSLAVIL